MLIPVLHCSPVLQPGVQDGTSLKDGPQDISDSDRTS
jgi:hypothetical protein